MGRAEHRPTSGIITIQTEFPRLGKDPALTLATRPKADNTTGWQLSDLAALWA
jgi:hypothetical protein